jgi:phosphatidate cytidylyltransferase
MNMIMDRQLIWLLSGVVGLLAVASVIGFLLGRNVSDDSRRKVIDNLNARIRAWWVMCAIFAVAISSGVIGSVVLFASMSFLALREFITLTPTHRGDHRTLFWVFFIVIPLHYYLVATRWYGLFSILIPVYAFLFVPLRSALAGETANFLERTAKIQWGLMVCVYCVSHAPALLMLDIPGYGGNARLLFFLVLVVQLSDVLQYVFGKTLGRRKIAPSVSPNKTWEGFLGGVACSSLIGAGLWWATPFTLLQAGGMALAINLMGFSGGLCMSAIKRDRGIKDFGTMIEGHGGIMDRIDSISFAAPVFFHLTRYYFT